MVHSQGLVRLTWTTSPHVDEPERPHAGGSGLRRTGHNCHEELPVNTVEHKDEDFAPTLLLRVEEAA